MYTNVLKSIQNIYIYNKSPSNEHVLGIKLTQYYRSIIS